MGRINVYPVPCSVCKITAGKEWISANLQVISVHGKSLYHGKFNIKQCIELNDSYSGIAILKLEKNGKISICKIVVEYNILRLLLRNGCPVKRIALFLYIGHSKSYQKVLKKYDVSIGEKIHELWIILNVY